MRPAVVHYLFSLGAMALVGPLPGCEKPSRKDPSPGAAQADAAVKRKSLPPAGNPAAQHVHFQFAIYYLPTPSKEPIAAVDALLKSQFQQLKRLPKVSKKPAGRELSVVLNKDPRKSYSPPDLSMLRYSGKGLTRRQAEQLQQTKLALVLSFAHPRKHVWRGLREANQLMERLARETGGVIWDEETRQVYSVDQWHAQRIKTWTTKVPDLQDHITIHAYKNERYVRAITLGMVKFGLPDIVVGKSSWSINRTIGTLINLMAQSYAEGTCTQLTGDFDLNLRSIKHAGVREPKIKSLNKNATGIAKLVLAKGTWEQGDPRNKLVELCFDRYRASDLHARQDRMVSSLFGTEDSLSRVKHTDELLAASRRAKKKLPSLRKLFNRGLAPGGHILLKAPFKTTSGGNEWMWVEVITWKGDRIEGLLKNEPANVPKLAGGQKVAISQQDVFDYIRVFPNKKKEGNETGKILQKQ